MTPLILCQLYSDVMSTYGDQGNLTYLAYLLRAQGIAIETIQHRYGQSVPKADIYIFGGGQDGAQILVARDLAGAQGDKLRHYLKQSYCLAICGGYQLLGQFYLQRDGRLIQGLGHLPIATTASDDRMVGPVILARQFGAGERTIVGFENHSGKSHILDDSPAFARVISGNGNNGIDQTEGIVYGRTIGTYLHGPLLPRNPHVAAWWLKDLLREYVFHLPPALGHEKLAHQAYLADIR